jgi:hypothetical protein
MIRGSLDGESSISAFSAAAARLILRLQQRKDGLDIALQHPESERNA